MFSHEMFLILFCRYILSMSVCMHCVCVYIFIYVQSPQCIIQYVCVCIMNWRSLHGALFLFDIHFNQQVETSTAEDPDSDSPTPASPSYPHLVENCCASSVFVHGELEYECPSLSACPLHQDVSPHTYHWCCVVSGKTIK